MITVSMCVEARLAFVGACDESMQCCVRTRHERQRIAVWVAFLGRWRLPINVLIMKAIEDALFSPLRGYDPIPREFPYAETRRHVRLHFRTKGERRQHLSVMNRYLQESREYLGRNQVEMSGARRLCHFLEHKLGLVLEDAPCPVGMLTELGRS